MRMNMEDEELVKMVNPTLKRRGTILFFLIVVINGLKCIVSNIGLDTCARGRWRVEVSKLEMNQPLGSSYLTALFFLSSCFSLDSLPLALADACKADIPLFLPFLIEMTLKFRKKKKKEWIYVSSWGCLT